MKIIPCIIAAASVLVLARAGAQESDYRVLKICESDYVLRTSDGADAGRIEYIVIDPAREVIVSAVVTGGIVAERFVTLPFSSFRLGTSREVVLTNIDRTRLISAPVIERTRITTLTSFDRGLVERSHTHFGLNVQEGTRRSSIESETRDRARSQTDAQSRDRRRTPGDATASDADRRRSAESARRPESTSRDAEAGNRTKPDSVSGREDKGRAEQPQQKGRPEDTPPQKRDATSKENALPEKSREQQRGERNADSSTRRNPEARPTDERKDQVKPGPSATEKEEVRRPGSAAESKNQDKDRENKAAPGATSPPRNEQPSETKPSPEAKEKSQAKPSDSQGGTPRRTDNPSESKSKKAGDGTEDERAKRKPQP